jgi:CheY-like chemotaxis protein
MVQHQFLVRINTSLLLKAALTYCHTVFSLTLSGYFVLVLSGWGDILYASPAGAGNPIDAMDWLLGRQAVGTILVIDDQEPIRSFLRVVLEGAGHQVLEASNGRAGLMLYRERAADLVITDLAMPEMNGLDLILELTKTFLDARVIAMTGEAEGMNTLATAKLLGARQTLQKPFSIEKLLSAVRYELAH